MAGRGDLLRGWKRFSCSRTGSNCEVKGSDFGLRLEKKDLRESDRLAAEAAASAASPVVVVDETRVAVRGSALSAGATNGRIRDAMKSSVGPEGCKWGAKL